MDYMKRIAQQKDEDNSQTGKGNSNAALNEHK